MKRLQVRKWMLADLARSGITPRDCKRLAYEPLLPSEVQTLGGRRAPGYRIPFHNGMGAETGYRIRYLDHKKPKYHQPKDSGVLIYRPRLRGKSNGKRAIVEGEKKAEVLAKHGYEVLGICGAQSYGTRRGDRTLHPDLRAFVAYWRGTILVALDGNAENPESDIGKARVDQCRQIGEFGAEHVEYIDIPGGANIDDYIEASGWAAFEALERKVFGSAAAFDIEAHSENVADLMARDVAEVRYRIYNLLTRGASSILGGPPKGFKSTLALYWALVIVGAIDHNWKGFAAHTEKARVGYLDLEQDTSLFKERLKSFKPRHAAIKRLIRVTKFPMLDANGIKKLREWILSMRLGVVIVDTVKQVRPPHPRGMTAQAADYAFMAPLTALAHETGCHIMVLEHNGKRKDHDNPIDMLSTTSALAGAADDILILAKPLNAESELQRTLYVSGRHIRDPGNYRIERTSTGWDMHGEVGDLVKGRVQKLVIEVLRQSIKPMRPAAIGIQIRDRGENVRDDTVRRELRALLGEGAVVQNRDGTYFASRGRCP